MLLLFCYKFNLNVLILQWYLLWESLKHSWSWHSFANCHFENTTLWIEWRQAGRNSFLIALENSAYYLSVTPSDLWSRVWILAFPFSNTLTFISCIASGYRSVSSTVDFLVEFPYIFLRLSRQTGLCHLCCLLDKDLVLQKSVSNDDLKSQFFKNKISSYEEISPNLKVKLTLKLTTHFALFPMRATIGWVSGRVGSWHQELFTFR